MRVKRYEAESMQEAIMKVRAELGRDAVILHSKKFRRGGAFGLFGRPMYEVIAAVDLPGEAGAKEKQAEEALARVTAEGGLAVGQSVVAPAAAAVRRHPGPEPVRVAEAGPAITERRALPAAPVARPQVQVGRVTVPVAPIEQTAAQVAPMPVRAAVPTREAAPPTEVEEASDLPPPAAVAAGTETVATPVLAEELAGLRRMIHELSSQLAAKGSEVTVARGWEELRSHLVQEELLPEYLDEIEAEVFRACSLEELQDRARVTEVVRRYFLKHFMVERRKAERPSSRRLIALVGPTGVGKTTTVAKLAAQYTLFGNRSVGLLTVDTYRIAAVDQLKTYAEIINIPVEVAFSPEEVKEALARLADREIVLMDTAGRSQKNDAQMSELRAYLAAAQPDEVHLVLATTTKQRDLDDCLAQFRGTGYQQLIFTKLDETDTYGAIFNCSRKARCPITYLTFGQNVPDDIEEASHERLAGLLLGTEAWGQ
ncbi:MAG: flagellar biosynthesis protein FlhF [Bacillota bacterium]|nr:flagellar biosynthesis protein FlhF [Bacillota bacterium]